MTILDGLLTSLLRECFRPPIGDEVLFQLSQLGVGGVGLGGGVGDDAELTWCLTIGFIELDGDTVAIPIEFATNGTEIRATSSNDGANGGGSREELDNGGEIYLYIHIYTYIYIYIYKDSYIYIYIYIINQVFPLPHILTVSMHMYPSPTVYSQT